MQRKVKSYFKACFLREELEARVPRTSTVAQIPRLYFLGAMPQTPAIPYILRRCINKVSLPVKFLFHLI